MKSILLASLIILSASFSEAAYKVTYGLDIKPAYSGHTKSARIKISGDNGYAFSSSAVDIFYNGIVADPYTFAARLEKTLNDQKISLQVVEDFLRQYNWIDLIGNASQLPFTLEHLTRFKVSYGPNATYGRLGGFKDFDFVITGPLLKNAFHSHGMSIPVHGKEDPQGTAKAIEKGLNNGSLDIEEVKEALNDVFAEDKVVRSSLCGGRVKLLISN